MLWPATEQQRKVAGACMCAGAIFAQYLRFDVLRDSCGAISLPPLTHGIAMPVASRRNLVAATACVPHKRESTGGTHVAVAEAPLARATLLQAASRLDVVGDSAGLRRVD